MHQPPAEWQGAFSVWRYVCGAAMGKRNVCVDRQEVCIFVRCAENEKSFIGKKMERNRD